MSVAVEEADMPAETSASIAQWAETTFGPVDSLDVLARRAQQEIDELREALARSASPVPKRRSRSRSQARSRG